MRLSRRIKGIASGPRISLCSGIPAEITPSRMSKYSIPEECSGTDRSGRMPAWESSPARKAMCLLATLRRVRSRSSMERYMKSHMAGSVCDCRRKALRNSARNMATAPFAGLKYMSCHTFAGAKAPSDCNSRLSLKLTSADMTARGCRRALRIRAARPVPVADIRDILPRSRV